VLWQVFTQEVHEVIFAHRRYWTKSGITGNLPPKNEKAVEESPPPEFLPVPNENRGWSHGVVEQQLWDGPMQVKTTDGAVVEVSDAVILAAAGVIYSNRRKVHGHPPLHAYHCRWLPRSASNWITTSAMESISSLLSSNCSY
jgi:hypothetical protein